MHSFLTNITIFSKMRGLLQHRRNVWKKGQKSIEIIKNNVYIYLRLKVHDAT